MDIHPIRDQIVVTKGKEEEKVSPGGLLCLPLAHPKMWRAR